MVPVVEIAPDDARPRRTDSAGVTEIAFWLWGTGSRFRGVSSDTLVQVIDLLR